MNRKTKGTSAPKKPASSVVVELRHLKIADAARRHSVAPNYIRMLIVRGELPRMRCGKGYVIPVEALDAYFAKLEQIG